MLVVMRFTPVQEGAGIQFSRSCTPASHPPLSSAMIGSANAGLRQIMAIVEKSVDFSLSGIAYIHPKFQGNDDSGLRCP